MDILDTLANVCSILAFFVSLFVANEAVKISKKINIDIKADNSNRNKQTAIGKNEQKISVGK